MKILVVEDDLGVRELMEFAISARGHQVLTAGCVEDAILRAPQVDAIVCDGNFPVSPKGRAYPESWFAVLAEAQELDVPFVLVTGDSVLVEQAQRVKVPALMKPAQVDAILAALSEVSAKSAQSADPEVAHG